MRITRRFEFDYGHRVLGHEGKCKYLHGHRGVAEVTVEAPQLDSLGRVIDFGVLKSIVGEWIDDHWDHQMILNIADPLVGTNDEIWQGTAPYILPVNPTAENLAVELFQTAVLRLPAPLKVVSVLFRETPSSWAIYEPSSTGKDNP